MSYYILFYETVADYVERRAAFREEHLNLAQQYHEEGKLVLAGAYADPPNGAALIFKGESPSLAEEFALQDPYVQNGLIKKWSIRSWTVVIGNKEV